MRIRFAAAMFQLLMPGSVITPRFAFPQVPKAGSVKHPVLNHFSRVLISGPWFASQIRFGRNWLDAPEYPVPLRSCVVGNCGLPVAPVKVPLNTQSLTIGRSAFLPVSVGV